MPGQFSAVINSKHNNLGVYGFEITWHQLNAVFPKHDDFFDFFGTGPAFWLIRRDIVAQAVSLTKMVTTKVAHTPHASRDDRAQAELAFGYDKALIKKWLVHILNAERGTEALFARQGITPLRMEYADMMSIGAEATARIMMDTVGATPLSGVEIKARHEKLATAQNAEYADRFREDCAEFVHDVEQERDVWLSKLVSLSDVN